LYSFSFDSIDKFGPESTAGRPGPEHSLTEFDHTG